MADKILFIFQFAYIIWPLFIVTALAYSLQITRKRGWLRSLGLRVHTNLLFTWIILLGIWIVTLFAQTPTPTLIPEPANTLIFFGGLALLVGIEIIRLRSLPRRIRARIDLHDAHGIAYLRQLDPNHFEELVAETYRALGYQAERTGKTGDHGIDVEVRTPKGERWVVQCKRYRASVGESVVRELYGTLMSEGAVRGVLITSADITAPAEAWARGKPIDLVDGLELLRLIERARRSAEGSLFDRLTNWLSAVFQPAHRPAGVRVSAARQPVSIPRPAPAVRRPAAAPQSALTRPGITRPAAAQPAVTRLAGSAPASPSERTQPVRVRPASAGPGRPVTSQRTCPHCGAPLAPHPERPGRNLYRCTRYPECRVVLSG